ncbi:MAG TPA: hypothetical protein DDY86_03875 [Syntrophaceae bacterium]|nr:hypothetical protein [Syntrophaceae bacterium]
MTADQLREARRKAGITMKQSADESGTPYRTWQDWEGGKNRVPGIAFGWLKLYTQIHGEKGTVMKERTDEQLAKLGLLMVHLNFPAGTAGYAELFTARRISEQVEADWLQRVADLNPEKDVSAAYHKCLESP